MASARELQDRIKSIKDTMKITSAMYMISSSKLQRAKKALSDTEPYFYNLQATMARVLSHMPEVEHLYFDNRIEDERETVKKKGYIVITADKGLAGAYNMNVIKLVNEKLEEPGEHHLFMVGEIGRHYFMKRKDVDMALEFQWTAQHPTMNRARMIAETIIDLYKHEQLDEVYVVYTQVVNSMKMAAVIDQVLPLSTVKFTQLSIKENKKDGEELTLVPSATAVINSIVPNYITGFLYGALVEAFASEQNARMLAMQTATSSAQGMLHELSIAYNRVRQAAITQEITEVIGGAKALKKKKKKLTGREAVVSNG
ncbi:MAG: ATP synthase F1 subunit gamma [Lachnospiraceae bacterium]|nr:ATP synthase F1 subunit gamma [Lachnospiraceae bacterium]